jgi:hypothetical protein
LVKNGPNPDAGKCGEFGGPVCPGWASVEANHDTLLRGSIIQRLFTRVELWRIGDSLLNARGRATRLIGSAAFGNGAGIQRPLAGPSSMSFFKPPLPTKPLAKKSSQMD